MLIKAVRRGTCLQQQGRKVPSVSPSRSKSNDRGGEEIVSYDIAAADMSSELTYVSEYGTLHFIGVWVADLGRGASQGAGDASENVGSRILYKW